MKITVHTTTCSATVEITDGIGLHLVGPSDRQVKDCLLRVCTALCAIGYQIPGKKIVIITNGGYTPSMDIAVAAGIMLADHFLKKGNIEQYTYPYQVQGELLLNGFIRNGYLSRSGNNHTEMSRLPSLYGIIGRAV